MPPSDGMLVVPGSGGLPAAGSRPEWKTEDFFKINEADEVVIKKALAKASCRRGRRRSRCQIPGNVLDVHRFVLNFEDFL